MRVAVTQTMRSVAAAADQTLQSILTHPSFIGVPVQSISFISDNAGRGYRTGKVGHLPPSPPRGHHKSPTRSSAPVTNRNPDPGG